VVWVSHLETQLPWMLKYFQKERPGPLQVPTILSQFHLGLKGALTLNKIALAPSKTPSTRVSIAHQVLAIRPVTDWLRKMPLHLNSIPLVKTLRLLHLELLSRQLSWFHQQLIEITIPIRKHNYLSPNSTYLLIRASLWLIELSNWKHMYQAQAPITQIKDIIWLLKVQARDGSDTKHMHINCL